MKTPLLPFTLIVAVSVLLLPATASARGGHHDSHTHHHLHGPSHAHWNHSPGWLGYRTYRTPAAIPLATRVQTALARRGYYRGPIDGIVGSGTGRALRAFQIERHLPDAGRIDRATLSALGLA